MSKNMDKLLHNYQVPTDEKGRVEIIRNGKKVLLKKQLNRHSYFNLLVSTLRFIPLKTWIGQFLIVFLTIAVIFFQRSQETSFQTIMNSYMILLIFSILFFLDELYRSFIAGMWQLEQTFKYDVRQHTLMKLIIFGLLDFLLILLISLLSNATLATPFSNIMLYLLVPFNIFSILLFSTLTLWRNTMNRTLLWCLAGAIASVSFVITNMVNIYTFAIKYWASGFVLTGCILVYIMYTQLNQINKEVG